MPKIPPWKQRLHELHLNPPHYEASWYGPLDKLANHVFAVDCFMVKPQPKIRRSAPPNDANNGQPFEDEGLSIDSMGTPVIPDTYFEPDFIIVHVKKKGGSYQSAGVQLHEYIEVLASKDPHDDFVGILVLGGKFYCFSVHGRRAPTPGGDGWETADNLEGVFEKVAKGVLGGKGKQTDHRRLGIFSAPSN
ncbi:uncharacterized protein BJ212DRAFT_1359160 [Suillus subaureus]|uniref:Uncharacterized protein n=1 Tax=Suillus subaureus TaxID=48587 RepID=A0A9P7JCV6_9AGAM|nr:uncharacterized protein BJ212DRAFT_1359160 [Suillus subaureus]KAG1815054.1 hypothetical protein BJ212DRAFT_1359160 [Suillus subaureus]